MSGTAPSTYSLVRMHSGCLTSPQGKFYSEMYSFVPGHLVSFSKLTQLRSRRPKVQCWALTLRSNPYWPLRLSFPISRLGVTVSLLPPVEPHGSDDRCLWMTGFPLADQKV